MIHEIKKHVVQKGKKKESCLHPHLLIQSPTQTTEITGQPSLLSADFKKFGPGYCKKDAISSLI